MPLIKVRLPDDYALGERLDLFVSKLPDGMNRSKLKSTALNVLVNGKDAKLSHRMKASDLLEIDWEENIPEDIEPENIPLRIIYEDSNVAVVNKAQGMVTHPASGHWNGTLVNALMYHWKRDSVRQLKEGGKNEILQRHRPGIVHRLDKDTSGLIITAKNRVAEEYLCGQFKERLLQKEYICIVTGRPPASSGDVRTQIVRDAKNRQKFKANPDTDEGKSARTIYHCIASYGPYSIIRVRIKTGRTHQIRVHMRYLGCPILGDSLYGRKDSLFPDATLMLHSRQTILKLPDAVRYHRFKASIPRRFYDVLEVLKSRYPREIPPKVREKCRKSR